MNTKPRIGEVILTTVGQYTVAKVGRMTVTTKSGIEIAMCDLDAGSFGSRGVLVWRLR